MPEGAPRPEDILKQKHTENGGHVGPGSQEKGPLYQPRAEKSDPDRQAETAKRTVEPSNLHEIPSEEK